MRARGLCRPVPGGPRPDFAIYLLGRARRRFSGMHGGSCGRTFGYPRTSVTRRMRSGRPGTEPEAERVEIACEGGRGRTGTALACIAALDGVSSVDAVTFVRRHYDQRAVETLWQRRYVRHYVWA